MAYQRAMQGKILHKGPWLEEEDEQLITFVKLLGERKWDFIAKVSGLKRSGKSCRLRWLNYLRPDIKRGRITAEEEKIIIQLQEQWGNKWSRIARRLPGRTDNEIKNYWRSHMRKKIRAREEGSITKEDFLHKKEDANAWKYLTADHSSVDDGVGTIVSSSLDQHELSNFTYPNSPYEIRLYDWSTELSDDQSKTRIHRDCTGLDSSQCCLAWNFEDRDTNIFDCLGSLWEMN